MKILKFILQFFTGKVVEAILSVLQCLKEFFSYKKAKVKQDAEEKSRKEEQEFLEKAKYVVDEGTIQDLVDLKR